MIHDLFELDFIELKELDFQLTEGWEFYVVRACGGKLPAGTRLELLQQILAEESVA